MRERESKRERARERPTDIHSQMQTSVCKGLPTTHTWERTHGIPAHSLGVHGAIYTVGRRAHIREKP